MQHTRWINNRKSAAVSSVAVGQRGRLRGKRDATGLGEVTKKVRLRARVLRLAEAEAGPRKRGQSDGTGAVWDVKFMAVCRYCGGCPNGNRARSLVWLRNAGSGSRGTEAQGH